MDTLHACMDGIMGSGYTTTPMTAWLKCTNRDDNRVGRGAGISIIGGGGGGGGRYSYIRVHRL
jgi:hypothetical protein